MLEVKVHKIVLQLKTEKFTIINFIKIFPKAKIVYLQMDNDFSQT